MMCRMARAAAVVVAAVAWGTMPSSASAVDIPLFTFEANEGIESNPFVGVATNLGLNGTGFGVTEGSQALVLNAVTQGCCGLVGFGADSGSSTGEELNNYNAYLGALAALQAGSGVTLSFDLGYDNSGVATDAFFQLGVELNSDAGFDQAGFGDLLGGNLGPNGDFPTLGGASGVGATLTELDPSSFAQGDHLGLVRVEIPLALNADSDLRLKFGDNGDNALDFGALGFTRNGGFLGVVRLSLDNIGFNVDPIPEPASLALACVGLTALVARRRRSA